MKKNMGSTDRLLRTMVAVAIVILFLTNVLTGTVAYVLLALAAVFVLTSAVGFCPIYAPLGFDTCPRKRLS